MPRFIRQTYPRADALVAVSEGAARELATLLSLPLARVRVIYNPIVSADTLARRCSAPLHPWFRSKKPPVILAAGRLHPSKDFPTLLQAFRHVRRQRDAKLVILGEGAERPRLQQLVVELGLDEDVALPGFVNDVYPYMQHCALFVSSSRWEGFSNVIVEALACGTQVVATDCPHGPAEILEHGRWGRLVSVADPGALASCITKALDEPPLDGGRRRASTFSVESAVAKYLSVMECRDRAQPSLGQ